MAMLTAEEREDKRREKAAYANKVKSDFDVEMTNTKGPFGKAMLVMSKVEGSGHIMVGIGALIYFSIGSGIESIKELTAFISEKLDDKQLDEIPDEELEGLVEDAKNRLTTTESPIKMKQNSQTK